MTAGSRPAREAARLVDGLERRIAPIDRAILLAEWRQTMGRAPNGAVGGNRKRHRLLSQPGLLEKLRVARSILPDPRSRRRAELLERVALDVQIEQVEEILGRRSALSRRVAAFRPRWHGRRVGRQVVRHESRTNPDRAERERAYRAEEPLFRPMEAPLRSLARLRNDRARALGFPSLPEFRLSFEHLSVARLRGLMEEATRWVRPEMQAWREEFEDRTGERGWYPWDVSYAENLRTQLPDERFPGDSMLPTVLQAVRRWGIPSSLLRFRVDRHDLPAGGISLAPDPPKDVRVVIHEGGGWERYMVLFHEVGHAVNSGAVRQPTHLLRWHEHVPGFAALSEGEGAFFEQIASSEAWLRQRPGLSSETIAAVVADQRRMSLWWIGNHVLWISRELALYEERGDPEEVARRLARRLFGFDPFDPVPFADHFSIELPLYAPSYFLATLLRPALTTAVLGDVGGDVWPNPKVGPWLIEHWFREGTSFDWYDRYREITGRPFGARPFLEETRPGAG
jgi:hypothetical protein